MELEEYQDKFKDTKERITQAAEAVAQYLAHARVLVHDKKANRALRKGQRHAHKALDIITQAQSVPGRPSKHTPPEGLFTRGVDPLSPVREPGGSSEMDSVPESDQLSSG